MATTDRREKKATRQLKISTVHVVPWNNPLSRVSAPDDFRGFAVEALFFNAGICWSSSMVSRLSKDSRLEVVLRDLERSAGVL